MAELADLDLFADADAPTLRRLTDLLAPLFFHRGQVLLRQGDPGRACAIVLDGSVSVERDGMEVAVLGAGSVVGELAMLTRMPRWATVRARTDVHLLLADLTAFAELVAVPSIGEKLTLTATRRIAANARPVPVSLRDGRPALLRPLLPSDRTGVAAGLANQSMESIRRRFFTEVKPNDRLVSFLVDIDYLNHFAWVVTDADGLPMGVGRYVRIRERPESAEVAFHVGDAFQGRGVGRLLVAALAPAAQVAGITEFTAEVLYDNEPMRRLLNLVGASWRHSEPGVAAATYHVDDAGALLHPDERAALREVVADVLGVTLL